MSYKINGTVVVDNSRNVCACCVTACCITGTTKVSVPYGDTASRPAAGAGVLYYDTDEGSLVVNDGTDWSAAGGAAASEIECPAIANNCDSYTVAIFDMQVQCRGFPTCCVGDCGWYTECCAARTRSWWHCCGPFNPNCYFTNCTEWQYYSCNVCAYRKMDLSRIIPRQLNSPYTNVNFRVNCCANSYMTYNNGAIEQLFSICPLFCSNCGCADSMVWVDLLYKPNGSISYNMLGPFPKCCSVTCTPSAPDTILANFTPLYYGAGRHGMMPYWGDQCGLGTITDYHNLCNNSSAICFLNGNCGIYLFNGSCFNTEIKSEFFGKAKYNFCDYALEGLSTGSNICAFCYAGRSLIGHYQNFGNGGTRLYFFCDKYRNCMISLNCGMMCHNFCHCYFANLIPKCPTFSIHDPASYTNDVACDPVTGAVQANTKCQMIKSVVYWHTPYFCNSVSAFEQFAYNTWNQGAPHVQLYTDDGCYMINFMIPGYCRVCYCTAMVKENNTCCNCCCCYCMEQYMVPMVEKIDLTTGCHVCAFHYCGLCGCAEGANTYWGHCKAAVTQQQVAITRCAFNAMLYCRGVMFNLNHERGGDMSNCLPGWKTYGLNKNHGGISDCVVKSCNCNVYWIMTGCGPKNKSVVGFNTDTMNWTNVIPSGCRFTKYSGSACALWHMTKAFAGCTDSVVYPCVCNCVKAFLAARGYDCVGGSGCCCFIDKILGYSSCLSYGSQPYGCGITFIEGGWSASYNDCVTGISSFINPETNQLVCLIRMTSPFCSTTTQWAGVVCFDLLNGMCISAVDTLHPTSGHFEMYAKCAGPCVKATQPTCWTGCDLCWAGRNCYCKFSVPTSFNQCACIGTKPNTQIATMSMYHGTDTDSGGVNFTFNKCMLGWIGGCIDSSCQINPFDPHSCGCFGYFGPCYYGKCVPGNTCCGTGCSAGLYNFGASFAVTKIPFDKPFCCSQMFERNDDVKLFMELYLGCHDLPGIVWTKVMTSCNTPSAACCLQYCQCILWCNFIGGEALRPLCKIDQTCAHTLNCPCIYRFNGHCYNAGQGAPGKNECITCSWARWDLENSPACWAICNTCNLFVRTNCPGCTWCTYQCAWHTVDCLSNLFNCDFGCSYCFCSYCYSHCCWFNLPSVLHCSYQGQKSCAFHNVLKCLGKAFYKGCEYNSDVTFASKKTFENIVFNCAPVQQGYCCNGNNCCGNQSTQSGLPLSRCQNAWRTPSAYTGMKGIQGMALEWFNTQYARWCCQC